MSGGIYISVKENSEYIRANVKLDVFIVNFDKNAYYYFFGFLILIINLFNNNKTITIINEIKQQMSYKSNFLHNWLRQERKTFIFKKRR